VKNDFGSGQERFGSGQERFGSGQERFGSGQEFFGDARPDDDERRIAFHPQHLTMNLEDWRSPTVHKLPPFRGRSLNNSLYNMN
ncbi:MAG: hypothetical protein HC879_10455, partial [Leptolyngbyaceae cyanobacterium SL_5_9]|nr:hypothetical protein [Leptolyngbyaceae cyanobacterium SL_5_9]